MDITLPKEMWYKIWSDLDFDTLQKICVLVCQEWFENIRGDGRLSGQLSLKNAEMEEEEATAILSKWKELRILRLSKNLDQVDLSKTHKFLKKVIIPYVPDSEGYQNLPLDFLEDLGHPCLVKKIRFNPQDKSKSIGLDNITELSLNFTDLAGIEESEKPFEPMGVMKNLIRLEIIFGEGDLEDDNLSSHFDFESIIEPLFQGIEFSSDLKEVRLKAKGNFYEICADLILRYLYQITRLEIVGIYDWNFEFEVTTYQDCDWSNIWAALPYKCNWEICEIENVLESLGSVQDLKISGCELKIPDDFDKSQVKSAMQKALEIIEKKFPFDSTEIEISVEPTGGFQFTISKEKGKGPSLKIGKKLSPF